MTDSQSAYYALDHQQCTHLLHVVNGQTRDVQEFLGTGDAHEANPTGEAIQEPLAHSPAMQRVLEHARRYARTHATVLLTGESGTGKEVLAQYIHRCSSRAQHVYLRVNCAALSETLIESELFGHERGAFTGADKERVGRFESAASGTLLLDEISEIPPRTQAKLLRVLEEEEFQRVGSNVTRRMSARIIATSNRDLMQQVASQEFRSDLYYRLNVLQLHLPPLRQRPDDIPFLVDHFVRQFGGENNTPVTTVTPAAMARLVQAEWPGNIRQLRNVIHRACILAGGGCIDVPDLLDVSEPPAADAIDLSQMRLEEIERHAILANLRRFHGNKTLAAQHLGVSSRTLTNKMKRYREMGWA